MLNQESLVDDITRRGQDGLLAEAHGRARETYTIVEILSRRNRKNVLLVGYTGVGKRRIVEGLALASIRGETDGLLGEVRVVELNFGMLLQGGEHVEKSLNGLVKYLRQTRDVILFVPEIDILLDSDSSEIDEAGVRTALRSVLLRGDITCIGSTTPGRYREVIERDSVARKAFEVVRVEPMTEAQAYEVITEVRPEIQAHHNVYIEDETIRAAVILSERYIKHSFLPGKAIDVLDRASSRFRLKKLAKAKKPELMDDESLVLLKDRVSPHDVRKAIEKLVGFEIRASHAPQYWEELSIGMRRKLTGQSVAIQEGIGLIRKAIDQLSEKSGPKCELLLIGPPRSGKRYWAEILAQSHFGHANRCIDVDLDNFDEAALLDGMQAAAGQGIGVAANDSARGTASPECVLFVKNVDSAPAAAVSRFLGILDGVGPEDIPALSPRSSIVLFASENPKAFANKEEYKESSKSWRVGLRQLYPRELLNRIHGTIPFFALEFRHHHAIMRNDVNALRKDFSKKGITVVVGRKVYELISLETVQSGGGVPDLRKLLYSKVVRPAEKLLEEAPVTARVLRIEVERDVVKCTLEDGTNAGSTSSVRRSAATQRLDKSNKPS